MGGTHPIHTAAAALERLAGLPGGPELLAEASLREDVSLVGGAVRDLLLGHWPRELDVTVGGDPAGLAERLAAAISPSERAYGRTVTPLVHERFGTATVRWGYGQIDIARLRVESYPAPGALPEVSPGTVLEDLARRDFTINAITLPLAPGRRGELLAVEHALEDLATGTIRVLHEASFEDDPTRLLRMARYSARLGFEIEPRTLELARAAISAGAVATVSGVRIAAELWLLGEEPDTAGLALLGELGMLGRLGLAARFDAELHAQAAPLLPADGERGILRMAILFRPVGGDPPPTPAAAEALMETLGFTAEVRGRTMIGAFGVDAIAAAVQPGMAASELRSLLAGRPPEAVAIIGALAARRSGAAGEAVARWLGELRHVRLQIDGQDLLAAGLEQGPEIGRRLDRALQARLDGRLEPGREAELKAALEAER
jgi:tRNA nucleotidyltransferase (CCA-adding enzyme)